MEYSLPQLSPVGESCSHCNQPFIRPRRRSMAPHPRSMALFSDARLWPRSYLGPFLELMASASGQSCCSTLVGSRKALSASCSAPSTTLKTLQVRPCNYCFHFYPYGSRFLTSPTHDRLRSLTRVDELDGSTCPTRCPLESLLVTEVP